MLETILITVALTAVMALLLWAAGWMLCNGTAWDWLLFGGTICRGIGYVLVLLAQVVSGSDG